MLYNLLRNETGKVVIYVDMDGVIVDFGEINSNPSQVRDEGFFINKRPVRTVIKELEKVAELPNVEIQILSITRTQAQIEEKNKWLNKYVPFITKRNIFARVDYSLESAHMLKGEYLETEAPKNKVIYLIDDDHEVLRTVKYKMQDKIKVLHVSSIIE